MTHAEPETKNLSVKYVDSQLHLAERNDCRGDVVERDEAALKFLVPHEQLAEAVEPTVADLDHPASGFLRRITPLGIGLFATINDVGNVAVRLDDLQCPLASVSGIGAQVLAASHARCLALDHDGFENHVELRDVMSIGSCHDERQRDATAVHQQVALAPLFFPDPSGCAPQPLAPGAP